MRTFSINTLGCKVNQYEGRQIHQFLMSLGLEPVQPPEIPDIAVINTCCVTQTASAKSRSYIHRAQKLAPHAAILICGCLTAAGRLGELKCPENHNIHIVKDRRHIAKTIQKLLNCSAEPETLAGPAKINPKSSSKTLIGPANRPKIKDNNPAFANYPILPQLTHFAGHTRAFLKVQDGCDRSCSYCIIPQTRPFVQSGTVTELLSEAHAFVIAGHREIVLTGVNLGSFGRKTTRRNRWPNRQNPKLAELLRAIAEIPHLPRVRLGSLDPADITENLLDVFDNHQNIVPHIHLSIQSASDEVLRRMARQYASSELYEKISILKERLDRPAITADIIVGFPGETERDFQQTIALATCAGFAKIHVFPFSPRPGTAAAEMKDKVASKVIKQRSKILRELGDKLAGQFRQQFLGRTASVLIENDSQPSGRCERYFQVFINGSAGLQKNDIVQAKLIQNTDNGAVAVLRHESEVQK